jgi:hypothetical protein
MENVFWLNYIYDTSEIRRNLHQKAALKVV